MKSKVFGLSVLSLIAATSMAAILAHADPSNVTPQLGDVVRNCDGSVRHMNQHQATHYCKSLGDDFRLPTAGELARLMNPDGVSEAFHDGFETIYYQNGHLFFFYNYRTYSADQLAGTPAADGLSAEELRNHFFWSSSIHPEYSTSVYVLSAGKGDFKLYYSSSDYPGSAVRCAR